MKTARLGDIALVFNGNSISAGEKDKQYRGAQGIPYVGTAEVGFDAEINYDAGVSIPVAKLRAFKVAQAGTALVCAEGGSAGRKVGLLDREVCFGNKLFAMQPKAGWDGKFLFYFSQSEEFRDQFRALTSGLIGGVSVKKFKGIQVPDFSHNDQRRIVAVLDEAFAAIATATSNAEKNLANARELFACELRKVFMVESENWVRKRLSEVAKEFGRGKSRHRPRGDPKLYGSTAPLIQTGDVSNADHWLDEYTQMYSELGVSQSKLWPRGTVCVAIVGANVGESAILSFSACFPDSVIGIVPDDRESYGEYIEYLLQFYKSELKEKGKGTARDNINIETFENILMPFPDVATQKRIVVRLNAAAAAVAELVVLIEAKQAALAELKQSLLQRTFAGELIAATLAANENWKAPEFTAQVIALAYRRHLALGTEATFGRVKAQKALHLCESVGGVDLGRSPIKDAAGPNDFQHMLAAEEWAKANQFFEFVPRPSGNGYRFKQLARFNSMVADGIETLQPVNDRLEKAIDLVVSMNSEQAELLATVHAAWNNLLLDEGEATEAAIIYEARENWHVAKQKFGDGKFRQAIATIRAKGIEPNGSAKRVGGQEALLF